MLACASSTSRSFTGPRAGDLVLQHAARPLAEVAEEQRAQRCPRRPSARAAACPSARVAQQHLDVRRRTGGARSSKVNISFLMRSAASRLRSSSALTKRFSVCRSRLLKISAIISWLSRRLVRARLDMNSDRSVRSTPSSTSRCTALHAQHPHHDLDREVLRQQAEHAAGVVRLHLGQHDRNRLRVFVLQVGGEHRLRSRCRACPTSCARPARGSPP